MSVLLALVLATAVAPCDDPSVGALNGEGQQLACSLLSRTQTPVETASLDELYAREGFERARERNSGAFEAFLAQLKAWFDRIASTTGAETYSNVTRIVVLGLALALGAYVTLLALRRRSAAIERQVDASTPVELALEDPTIHRARATSLLETDPRGAIREGLLWLLSSLERRRLARPDRVKTNREIKAELISRGADPSLIATLTPLFTWFDRAFYSLDPVTTDDARGFLKALEAATGDA